MVWWGVTALYLDHSLNPEQRHQGVDTGTIVRLTKFSELNVSRNTTASYKADDRPG